MALRGRLNTRRGADATDRDVKIPICRLFYKRGDTRMHAYTSDHTTLPLSLRLPSRRKHACISTHTMHLHAHTGETEGIHTVYECGDGLVRVWRRREG